MTNRSVKNLDPFLACTAMLRHHPDPALALDCQEHILWTNEAFDRGPNAAHHPQTLGDLPFTEKGLEQIRTAITLGQPARFWLDDIEVTLTPAEEPAVALLFLKPWTMPNLGLESGDWTAYLSLMHNPFLGIWRLGFPVPISIEQPPRQIAEAMVDTGVFIDCNDTMARMYRFSGREAMLGKPVKILYPSREPVVQRILSMVQNGYRSELMDSVEVDQEGQAKAFRNAYFGHLENGRLHWVSGIQMDITERYLSQVQIEVLHHIAHSALMANDLGSLYDVIRAELGRIIDTTNFYVVSLDPESEILQIAVNYDTVGNVNPPTGRSMASRVIQSRKGIRLKPQQIRDLDASGEIEMEHPIPNSWMGVPLVVRDQVIGVMVVQSYGEVLYSDDDLKVLQLVADQAAMAIHRKQALDTAMTYRRQLGSLIQNIPESVYTFDPVSDIHPFMSERWEVWTGVSPSVLKNDTKGWEQSVHPEDRERVVQAFEAACDREQDYLLDYRIVHRETGKVTCLRDQGIRVQDENGVHYDGIISDVTDFRIHEARLRASLQEKEMLIKEVHHRVKNNLQIIMSLLNLQAHKTEYPEAQEHLRESQNRVRSMAMIHEKLYRSESMTHIDFNGYLKTLATQLFQAYHINAGQVELSMDIDALPLTMDFAVPCGLILNELISNALKYAFPPEFTAEKKLCIRLKSLPDQRLALDVFDTGIGLDQPWDTANRESLGLHLVELLVQDQLNGTLSHVNDPGSHFHMEFPMSTSSFAMGKTRSGHD